MLASKMKPTTQMPPLLHDEPLRDPAEVKLEKLADHPRYRAAMEEIQAYEKRLEKSEQELRVGQARNRGQHSTTSIADRAAALVRGGRVMTETPAAQLEAAREEIEILRRALAQKRDQLDAIASELSFEACSRFAEMNAAALRVALQAATQLHTALHANRIIRGRLIGAGYSLNESALPTHMFPSGAAVGDPKAVGMSPAAMFRAWLKDKEIIE